MALNIIVVYASRKKKSFLSSLAMQNLFLKAIKKPLGAAEILACLRPGSLGRKHQANRISNCSSGAPFCIAFLIPRPGLSLLWQ